MKIALVHDYLVDFGGAERVFGVMHQTFPDAPVFTSIYDPRTTWDIFRQTRVQTSFLQLLPHSRAMYKALLPLYPLAFEHFDFRGFDVVLSSSSAFAKGVITGAETRHFNFCHTPSRFAWRYHEYVERDGVPAWQKAILPLLVHYLRLWDVQAAARVDSFAANSKTTAERIRKFYRRESVVINSPIEVGRFHVADELDDYFLVVSRMQVYKRLDVAIQAFNQLGRPLRIVGGGPDRPRLERLAGPNVRFLGEVGDKELAHLYARCQAVIFPGEEDFGLVPLEAMASGRPVIAFAAGGALETVVAGESGLFFSEPTAEALAACVQAFHPGDFDPAAIRRHAEQFDAAVFQRKIRDWVTAPAAGR